MSDTERQSSDDDSVSAADPAVEAPAAPDTDTQATSGGVAIRLLASIVGVWAVSALAYVIHVSFIPAIAFLVAGIMFLKIGERVVDRFLAILVAAVAYVVLIAWVSPFVPALFHPITLVGILGTVPAVAWALGQTKRPGFALADGVSIGVGVVGAILWCIPMWGLDRAKIIDALFFGPDNAPHIGMFSQVWRVHGYEFLANSPVGNITDFASYPQAVHAVFAAFASVLTSSFDRPTIVPLEAFAICMCLLTGLLALTLSWSVDRLIRGLAASHKIRSAIGQLLPALMLIIGPAAWILMSSVSFSAAAVLLVTSFTFLSTARTRPRLATVLVAFSVIGMCAMYPLLGVFAPIIWVALLIAIKNFALRNRLIYVVITLGTVMLCTPMFIMLIFRNANHNLDTAGVFEPIPIALYVGSAFALAAILAVGASALPGPIVRFAWPTGVATLIFSLGAIIQWTRLDAVPYYSVKSMYATLLLTLVVLAAAIVAFSVGWEPKLRPNRGRRRSLLVWLFAGTLALTSGVAGVLLVTAPGNGEGNGFNVVPGYHWIAGDVKSNIGATFLAEAQLTGTERTPVIIPCESLNTFMRWQSVVTTGRIGPESTELLGVSCAPAKFVSWLQNHPSVQVDAYVKDESIRAKLLTEKKKLGLNNLRIIAVN